MNTLVKLKAPDNPTVELPKSITKNLWSRCMKCGARIAGRPGYCVDCTSDEMKLMSAGDTTTYYAQEED